MTTKGTHYVTRLTVGFTREQDQWLSEASRTRSRRGQLRRKADIVREAVDFYVMHQPDLPGSRKAIAQSIEGKIAALEQKIDYIVTAVTTVFEMMEGTDH